MALVVLMGRGTPAHHTQCSFTGQIFLDHLTGADAVLGAGETTGHGRDERPAGPTSSAFQQGRLGMSLGRGGKWSQERVRDCVGQGRRDRGQGRKSLRAALKATEEGPVQVGGEGWPSRPSESRNRVC